MTLLARCLRDGLLWCLGALLTLPLVVAGAGLVAVVATLPGGDRADGIVGLSAPATVEFDADGIARIRAANHIDAAAALGYAHARDRMFQMELMRRAASGTLSALAGPATLNLDRLTRTLGLRRDAARELAGLDADTRAMLDAYAAGVNAWIAARGRRAALEFLPLGQPAPWTPVDSLLWGKTMALYLSGNWRTELARLALLPTLGTERTLALWPDSAASGHPEAALALPGLGATAARLAALLPTFPAPFTLPDTASNAWAVDGRHSASGAPLLAGDPHLAFGLPGIWYLARIDTPGRTLAGATAPGVPFLVLGHNGHIAWSFTTTGADTEDLFIETPAGPGQYATPDGPRPIATRTERIAVRGRPDVMLTVRETRHGPLVSDLVDPGGPMLALASASLMPGDTAASGLLALDRATNVEAAGAAAARITAPVQNMIVADRQRIALFVTGRVPLRRAGDGALPQAGADGRHDWTGFASGAALPHLVAPASGRLVNANERVAPPDFPVFLGRDWFADVRARRIREMLDENDVHTPADFAAMQSDARDRLALDLLPRLLRVVPADAASRAALALLRGWDAEMTIGQPQPLIFTAWMRRFAADMLARLGVPPRAEAAAAPWPDLAADALATDRCAGGCDAALSDSLAAALRDLARRFGDTPAAWRWGTAHPAVFADPLLRGVPWLSAAVEARIASPGGETTVDRGGLAPGSFDSVHGASFRGVYDLADLDRSLFVVAPGQSGHPASPLARNFVRRWRDGAAIMIGPYAEAIQARITLSPLSSPLSRAGGRP
jgi:penicillin amidase